MGLTDLVNKLLTTVNESIAEIEKDKKKFSSEELRNKLFGVYLDLLRLKDSAFRSGERDYQLLIADTSFFSYEQYYEKELQGLNESGFEEFLEIIIDEVKGFLEEMRTKLLDFIDRNKPKVRTIKVTYSKKYLGKLKKIKSYRDNKDLIKKVEGQIRNYFLSGGIPGRSKLAKSMVDSKTKNIFHAWLPEPIANHRLLYLFVKEKNEIIFEDILSHRDMAIKKA